MRTPNERELPSAPPAARAEPNGGEFSVMLRLGAHGEILKNSGGSEEIAETVAYVRRLTELAGELLGIEGFSAFECTFKESRCFVYVPRRSPVGMGDQVAQDRLDELIVSRNRHLLLS